MAVITVRHLDERLKAELRLRAARNARSMEEEVRNILKDALLPEVKQGGLGSRLHQQILATSGGISWQAEPRHAPRAAPTFDPAEEAK